MSTQANPIAANGRIRVWDLPLRVFHWLLVVAVALAFLSSEEDSALSQWHIISGWVAGVLIVFRLAWGFVGGEHSRFSSFIRPSAVGAHVGELLRGRPEPSVGHNALGAISVLLLLLLIGATVWTGATLPGGAGEEAHELIAWTLLALVVVHVVAVILMSLLTRENLVRAMIGGTKSADRNPAARDARAPGVLALLLGLLVIAGTAYAITAYDPQAFTLRSAESFEHRAAGSGERVNGDDGEAGHAEGD